MGRYTVGEAIIKLHGAGIRAQRGYPGTLMPQITDTVAAVNLHKSDPEGVTIVARICTPMSKGVYACEDVAKVVENIWTQAGASVSCEDSGFDGKSGLYQMAVYGRWEENPPEENTAEG